MIHFLYKWLLWKRRYIIEMNTFRNSFRKFCDLLPLTSRCFSTLAFARTYRPALNANANAQWYCYSEWVTFMYNTMWCDVLKYPNLQDEGDNYFSILMQLCQKLCICDRLTRHTSWESIWCRKNSTSCHNVMYNTEIIKILTLCVQIALSLRQDLNIIVSLASIGQPNMILYNPIFILCMHKRG